MPALNSERTLMLHHGSMSTKKDLSGFLVNSIRFRLDGDAFVVGIGRQPPDGQGALLIAQSVKLHGLAGLAGIRLEQVLSCFAPHFLALGIAHQIDRLQTPAMVGSATLRRTALSG